MTKKRYETLGWPDIDALDKEHTIVMIPIGATEQHGRHLPLGTDSIDAQYLADQIAEDVGALNPSPTVPVCARNVEKPTLQAEVPRPSSVPPRRLMRRLRQKKENIWIFWPEAGNTDTLPFSNPSGQRTDF